MKGWKTWAGAILVIGSGALGQFGMADVGHAVFNLGVALGLIGVGHKIEKNGRVGS